MPHKSVIESMTVIEVMMEMLLLLLCILPTFTNSLDNTVNGKLKIEYF